MNFESLSYAYCFLNLTSGEIDGTARGTIINDIFTEQNPIELAISISGALYPENDTIHIYGEGLAWFPSVNITLFDTGCGTYPSIFGTHTGTITPNQTIIVSKLYTYPCPGTGGHSEYARIWNASWEGVEAYWNGYQGDWHNISFDKTFTLVASETYNYTIRTGSYPQIHHSVNLTTPAGIITCTEFVDANGKKYDDWIPCIKLEVLT